MPGAFLVRAKDGDGNPVTMMIAPNSMTALPTVPGNGGQGVRAAHRMSLVTMATGECPATAN